MTYKSDKNTKLSEYSVSMGSQQSGSDEVATIELTTVSSFPVHALVMTLTAQKPIYQGQGKIDYVCGHCAALILHRVNLKNARGLVFECMCGTYNVLPAKDVPASSGA
jgi:hypothetical protein